MGSPPTGLYAIRWSQCALDGDIFAPFADLRAGARLRWSGRLHRLDGPTGILPLPEPEGARKLRARAAARLGHASPEPGDPTPPPARLVLSDGIRRWDGMIVTEGREPLLVFEGVPPTRDATLWVVRALPPKASPGPVLAGFAAGTPILTDRGYRPVDALRPGDLLQTIDAGLQPVAECRSLRIGGARMRVDPTLCPVRIGPGTLGPALPNAELLLSPDQAVAMPGGPFGAGPVLAAAKDLVHLPGVAALRGLREVVYHAPILAAATLVQVGGVRVPALTTEGAVAPLDMRRLSPGEAAILIAAA